MFEDVLLLEIHMKNMLRKFYLS